jgi:dephospho-CoA kinase
MEKLREAFMNHPTDNDALPRIWALTGTIGSGKSTVARLFQERGVLIIDADVLARRVVEPGTAGFAAVVQRFGQGLVLADGTLNRQALGGMVFSDKNQRRALEQILHPLIRAEYERELSEINAERSLNSAPQPILVLYVIPLFYETSDPPCGLSGVIVVWAPEEVCIERIMARNGYTRKEAEDRIKSQNSIDEKAAQADYVIRNDGSIDELEAQVDSFLNEVIGKGELRIPND